MNPIILQINAQQIPMYTQVQESGIVVNPAAVSRDFIINSLPTTISAGYRSQFSDLDGAPKTQSLRFSHFIEDKSLDVGGFILNDNSGAFGYTGLYAKGAYHLDLGGYNHNRVALGLTAGLIQQRLDLGELNFNNQDETPENNIDKKFTPDLGIGVFYFSDLFYGGISIPQTIGLKVKYDDLNDGDTNFEFARVQHIYASGGAYFLIDDYTNSYIEPNLAVKFVSGAPINADISARYRYKETFFVGAGYSSSNSALFEAGLMLNENVGMEGGLQLSYGYGSNFQDYGPAFGAAHEINLVYSFGY